MKTCVKCGCQYAEGIFCPECGHKYDQDEFDAMEQERLAKEKVEQERLAKEKAEQERLAKEKAEQERIAKEKAEQERIAKEKAEQERIEKEKQEILARTYKNVVYATKNQADIAKEEDEKIDLLKIQLEGTKSQSERQEILKNFNEKIQTIEMKKRMELLRQKVNQPVPKAEKNNKYVGLLSVVMLVVGTIICSAAGSMGVESETIYTIGGILITIAFVGIIVWLVRKVLIGIKKKTKGYYLYIKDI